MRLRPCSRTGSRKSRHRLLFALVLAATSAHAQIAHTVDVAARPDYLEVSLAASGADAEAFLGNIEDGFRSRIEFELRFSIESGIFGLGRDQLPQFTLSHDAWWDPFRDRYVIEANDGVTYTFREAGALWSFFFSLPGFRVPWSELADPHEASPGRELELQTRVSFYPVVFAPGLRILAVILPDSRQTSGWTTHIVPDAP